MPVLIECVPNFSEGRDKAKVDAILEAMKMQNELKSPRAGTIGRVRIKPGEWVEQRQKLLSVQ